MKLLILLTLIGAAVALQYPIEYQYRYEARIGTAVPGIAPQVAGLGMKATVNIQMKTRSQAVVQIKNLVVGAINTRLPATFLRQAMPIVYSPINSEASKIMELPFSVNLLEDKNQVMDVSEKDPLWITNIRKAVVDALLVEPVRYNKDSLPVDPVAKRLGHVHAPASFAIQEETIFGKCEVQYTITELRNSEAMEIEKMLQDQVVIDVQARRPSKSGLRTTIPKIGTKLWRMVRAVNFDNCDDPVVLQHSSISNTSRAANGQWASLMSRASVGQYILRGETGQFRVEKASVEGSWSKRPFGMHSEKIFSLTNQTIILVKAAEIEVPLMLPTTKPVKSWRYEVKSPYSPPFGKSKIWVDYTAKGTKFTPASLYRTLLGKKPNYQLLFVTLEEDLQKAAEELSNEPSVPAELPIVEKNKMTSAAHRLSRVSAILEMLPIEKIQEIFKHFFDKDSKRGELEKILLVDCAAAAGTAAPIKVLIEYMEDRKVTSGRAASIFLTLTNQVSAPSVVPELMEYAKTIDVQERPYLASAVLINFARLARRMCLHPENKNYTAFHDIYGSESCEKSRILDSYLPFLEQQLRVVKRPYEKAILVQAISELGVREALPILTRVAQGEFGQNQRVRSIAIHAMSASKMTKKARREVYDVLIQLIETRYEEPSIRQAAIVSLFSHNPPPAFYQRLAKMTYSDRSDSTAAFAYYTLDSLARNRGHGSLSRASRAKYVLTLARPFAPSTSYSFNFEGSNFIQNDELRTEYSFSSILNPKSIIPKEVYVMLKSGYSGFEVSPIQVGIFTEGLNSSISRVIEELHKMRLEEREEERHNYERRHPKSKIFEQEEVLEEIRKLKLDPPMGYEPDVSVLVRVLDNMVSYLPFNKDIIERYAGSGAHKLLRALQVGVKYNATKYVDMVEQTVVVPSELGLPVISRTKMPTIQYCHGFAKLNMSNETEYFRQTLSEMKVEKNIELLASLKYKLISRVESKMMVYSPWDDLKIETGIDAAKVVTIPLYLNVTVANHRHRKRLMINLSSMQKKEFAPLYAHNIPYTAIKPALPIPMNAVQNDAKTSLKIISLETDLAPMKIRSYQLSKKLTGISSTVRFSGDVSLPSVADIQDYLTEPQKITKLFASPSSRQWTTALLVNPHNSQTKNISITLGYASGYKDVHENLLKKKMSDIKPDHIYRKLVQMPLRKTDVKVKYMEAKLLFNGTSQREYDAFVALSSAVTRKSKNDPTYRKYGMQLNLRAHPAPGDRAKPREIVVEADFTTPNITTIRGLHEKIKSNSMKEKMMVSVSLSPNYENPVIVGEGRLSVTQERTKIVSTELKDICQYDPRHPTDKFQVAGVYDLGEFKIDYKLNQLPNSILNMSYLLDDALKGSYYPHVAINRLNVDHKPEQISIYMQRPIRNRYFQFQVEKPTERVVFDKVALPGVLSMIPYYGLEKPTCHPMDKVLLPDMSLSSCKVTKREIKPFNKMTYPFHPLKCYTKVAFDPTQREKFVIKVREDAQKELEVKATSTLYGVSIVLSNSKIRVNGKKVMLDGSSKYIVEDSNRLPVAQLFLVPDEHIYAIIDKRYMIRLRRNDLHIFDLKPRGKLIGACGSTESYDMVGPEGCIFRPENSLLLKYAYTEPEGKECDTKDYEAYNERVMDYRRRCAKQYVNLRSKSGQIAEKLQNCEQYVYPVITDSKGSVCIAESPVRKCNKNCYPEESRNVELKMKCWPRENAPRQVLESSAVGYSKHPEADQEVYEIGSKIKENTFCKPLIS